MIKEIELFNEKISNIESRIDQLSAEVVQKTTEYEQAAKKYKTMMIEDSVGAKTYTTDELNKAKMRIDALSSEIQVAEERLRMVEASKKQQFRGFIVNVQQVWEAEVRELADKINAVFEVARENRAKLILEIQKGNVLYQQAYQKLRELNEAETRAGLAFDERTRNVGIPETPPTFEVFHSGGFSSTVYTKITDKCVIPSEEELIKAYQFGAIPAWVEHFAKTGELLTDEMLKNHEVSPESGPASGVKGLLDKVKKAIPKTS